MIRQFWISCSTLFFYRINLYSIKKINYYLTRFFFMKFKNHSVYSSQIYTVRDTTRGLQIYCIAIHYCILWISYFIQYNKNIKYFKTHTYARTHAPPKGICTQVHYWSNKEIFFMPYVFLSDINWKRWKWIIYCFS